MMTMMVQATLPETFEVEMKNSEDKKIRFGLSIIQGFAGGMLGGLAYFVVSFSQAGGRNFNYAISFLPVFLVTFAILGCVKATIMWSVYRAIGRTLPALARVSTSTFLSPIVLAFTALYFEFEEDQIAGLLIPTLSLGIPVALMVGSSVKPWELFTFGSIAAGEVDHRTGSRSILATLATLPLRFLGIGVTVFLLLYKISEVQPLNTFNKFLETILFFVLYGAYPAFSAYVTFRSPRKIVLTAFAVIINVPIALLGMFFYGLHSKAYGVDEGMLIISEFCGLFVAAWIIFLVARLSVDTNPVSSLTNLDRKSIEHARNLDHDCLGSRFADWQERVV